MKKVMISQGLTVEQANTIRSNFSASMVKNLDAASLVIRTHCLDWSLLTDYMMNLFSSIVDDSTSVVLMSCPQGIAGVYLVDSYLEVTRDIDGEQGYEDVLENVLSTFNSKIYEYIRLYNEIEYVPYEEVGGSFSDENRIVH